MSEEAKGTESGSSSRPAWLDRLLTAPGRFRQFLHEVRQELNRVTWPTRDDIKATTVVVIMTIFFFGLFLAVADQLIIQAVERILNLKF